MQRRAVLPLIGLAVGVALAFAAPAPAPAKEAAVTLLISGMT